MLQERIKRTLESRKDIDQRKLARIADTSESTISRYLNGYDEISFESALRIVKYLYPDEEVEIMAEYVLTQKSRNARFGMEYCAMNRLHDELDVLIDNLSNAVNPLDKEWAAVYKLLRMRTEKLIPSFELLQKVEMLKPKELEMQVLKTVLKGYLYFDMDEHHSFSLHMEGIESLIQEISSSFIRESFYVRISQVMSAVNLYANNLVEARRYSYAVVGQDYFEHFKAGAYNNLGQSYMFEDYQKSENYYMKALDYFIYYNQMAKTQTVKLNLSFLYSFWNVEREFTEALDDHESFANYIYYLIKKEDLSLALEYLNKIDTVKLTEWDKGFYYYYKGLLTRDIATFYNSIEAFLNVNNYFYLQLPLIELQKLGENEEALKILSKRGNLNEKARKNPIR